MRCFFFGHKTRVVQDLSAVARKLQCRRCQKYFALHSGGWLIRWDFELEHLYGTVLGLGKTLK